MWRLILTTKRLTKMCKCSYGRKRALAIATTIAFDPAVTLLDERMAGMRQPAVERTVAPIKQVATGGTVVARNLRARRIASHCLNPFCAAAYVVARGRELWVRARRRLYP